MLPLRGFVMFPNMILHFDIGRKKSIAAAQEALKSDQLIFLTTQKNIKDEDPKEDGIYSFGVLATVKQILKQTDEMTRILIEGKCRAHAVEVLNGEDYMKARVSEIHEDVMPGDVKTEALVRKAEELFAEYISLSPRTSGDLILNFPVETSAGKVADYIASNVMLDFEDKQAVLSEIDPVARISTLISLLSKENTLLAYEIEIASKLKNSMDKSQKEFFLREQIRILSSELGSGQDPITEADEYMQKLEKLSLPKEVYKKLKKECQNFPKIPAGSSEANIISTYLDTCFDLPWNKSSKESLDTVKAKKILDKDHYGLEDVKERILEFLAVRKLSDDIKGQIICLVGPPGVGKTSVAKSLAKAMGRKFVRISLGGVNDESEIRGHRKTYIGAMPGRIITALKQVGVNNPLILLDEIDKLANDYRGDPASALLEALDPEQNSAFYDRYLEVPFDLSKAFFITTANDKDNIPAPLYDRMEIIELYSYSNEEKFQIAKNHLIPKQMKRHGLTSRKFKIDDLSINELISRYTKEAGVRELERKLSALMRKAAKKIVEKAEKSCVITTEKVKEMLGSGKYRDEIIDKNEHIGVANGLAWTSVGGEMLPIETALMPGKGEIQLTGSLGDVMRESAQLAVSYVRAHAKELKINADFYKNKDIHIHAPEGATPKDGPSAGVTMLTSLISELTGNPVADNVAMTGEITLKGKVIPIGGLKEKSMAAYKAGMKKILIPAGNVSDLEKIDDAVKKSVKFIPVEDVKEVLKYALVKKIKGNRKSK